jgi:1,4-alpha-glucan branching enzyme
MNSGYLSLVLHAHLPFVRHPDHEDFLEEDWLYEAITETYIPLLWTLESLENDDIDYRLAMSISPPLISMWNDDLLRRRYVRRLDRLCELAGKEEMRTRNIASFHETAVMYRDRFFKARDDYTNHWRMDLSGAFRRVQDAGHLELLTSAATHGYLPLLQVNSQAVRAQVLVALEFHRETFGGRPAGFWLPECGFYPGLDQTLKDAGLRYFFVDAHSIHRAKACPLHDVFAPLYCPSGVAAFGRDPESAKQVWSSVEGYPGDFDYREFYRDIGFDLDLSYIGPYIHRDGIRVNTGIKYHRVTGATEEKEPYVHPRALEKAELHASDFLRCREKQAQALAATMSRPPLMVAPYDAELFGHWWFEGPEWLNFLLRRIARGPSGIRLIHPSEYLREYPMNQLSMPAASSWGYQGYSEVWLNASNDWIYRHLHRAADQMVAMAERHPAAAGIMRRALNQAARELLLAQASDWAFIMTRNTVVPYAVRRTQDHLLRFQELHAMVQSGAGVMNESCLVLWEAHDNIFPGLDYRVYRRDYQSPHSPQGGSDSA